MELVAELVADNQATDFGTGVTKPTGLTTPTGNGPFGFAAALLFTPDIAQQARRDRSWMSQQQLVDPNASRIDSSDESHTVLMKLPRACVYHFVHVHLIPVCLLRAVRQLVTRVMKNMPSDNSE